MVQETYHCNEVKQVEENDPNRFIVTLHMPHGYANLVEIHGHGEDPLIGSFKDGKVYKITIEEVSE